MSIWSRIKLILRIKGHSVIDDFEDPREVLGYADEQQQELLSKVRQGLVEVAISKRQLQQQVEKVSARVPRMDDQAKRALASGREDLARLALERKRAALAELAGIEAQVEQVGEEEARLTLAEQQLAARIEEFHTRRQTLSARYAAAEAQARVNEALSGVSKDFADLGMALGRAEAKIDFTLARASALDALIDSGALAPIGTTDSDMLERELRELADQDAIEEELAKLRAELDSGKAPRPLKRGPRE